MKPFRLTFFVILLIFHLALVIISFNFTPGLADRLVEGGSVFRGFAIFGLIIALVVMIFAIVDRLSYRRRIERLEAEKDRIKAEVFDIRQQERLREKEIEREIESFEKSLPSSNASSPTSYSDESHLDESRLNETHQAEPNTTKSNLTDDPDPSSQL